MLIVWQKSCWVILFQQVNIKAQYNSWQRICEHYEPISWHLFGFVFNTWGYLPSHIADLDPINLNVKLTPGQSKYIENCANDWPRFFFHFFFICYVFCFHLFKIFPYPLQRTTPPSLHGAGKCEKLEQTETDIHRPSNCSLRESGLTRYLNSIITVQFSFSISSSHFLHTWSFIHQELVE